MGNELLTYIGAYLEVIPDPEEEYAFDVDDIDQDLRVHDSCSHDAGDPICWIPNSTSKGYLIDETSGCRKHGGIPITQDDIDNCLDNFQLEFAESIAFLKKYYGNGVIKFGYVAGWN